MAIRYDKKLNQEINKTIKNFNQKIARLEKQERELLPTKITKKQLKENVYTRAELRRKLKELQRFSSRGAEEVLTTKSGVRLTKYEMQNIKKESARIKRKLTREIKRLETTKPKVFGKVQSATFSQMGTTEYLNTKARRQALEKDIQLLSSEEIGRYKKLLEKTGRNQEYMNNIFKDNYYKMLTDLGYYTGYDNKKLSYLKEKLDDLEPSKFYDLFKNESAIQSIIYYYAGSSSRQINPDDIKGDVSTLYDALIDNIDDIIKDYA